MERMLVTAGLNEIKTIDARITRIIDNSKFVDAAKTIEKKVNPSVMKEEFHRDALSAYDSIIALINRRESIKNAIVESNAKTMVEICGKILSIAKVIDMKSSIAYQKRLLLSMKNQYESAISLMNRNNLTMEAKIDQLVSTAFGKESKSSIKPEDYDSIAVPYRKSNEFSLVDPLTIKSKIEELETFIEDFEKNVDSCLQISNCTTWIEF